MSEFARHAAHLRTALEEYLQRYPDERSTVERVLGLLSAGEPAFHRDHLPGHFTASALVFSRDLSRLVLTHHRKLDIWIQLGGHADGEADLPTAARREAVEESGIEQITAAHDRIVDVDIHPIPAHGREGAHEHYDIRYAFVADHEAPLIVSDESHDLAWVTVEQLAEFSEEESLHRAVRKALREIASR